MFGPALLLGNGNRTYIINGTAVCNSTITSNCTNTTASSTVGAVARRLYDWGVDRHRWAPTRTHSVFLLLTTKPMHLCRSLGRGAKGMRTLVRIGTKHYKRWDAQRNESIATSVANSITDSVVHVARRLAKGSGGGSGGSTARGSMSARPRGASLDENQTDICAEAEAAAAEATAEAEDNDVLAGRES
jgi:hypothetical protein